MSTKPIREALTKLKRAADLSAPNEGSTKHDEAYAAALEAVRAIEEMARSIVNGNGTAVLRNNDYDTSVSLLESIAKEAP
jgi:hypothetical protein